jgi:hypothetical protein
MALLESWIPRLIITFPLKLIFVGDFEGKHFQTHPNDPLNTRLLGPNSTAHRNSELLRNAAQRRSAAAPRSIVLAGLYQVVQTRALREMIRSLQARLTNGWFPWI